MLVLQRQISLSVHVVPGEILAQEAAGGHREGRQCYQVLSKGPVQTIPPF